MPVGLEAILPHKAVAKLDSRLVPDMRAADSLAKLRAHLVKHGFGDSEINMTGGYDPTTTPADSSVIRAAQAVYRGSGIDPILFPRLAGPWPGYDSLDLWISGFDHVVPSNCAAAKVEQTE